MAVNGLRRDIPKNGTLQLVCNNEGPNGALDIPGTKVLSWSKPTKGVMYPPYFIIVIYYLITSEATGRRQYGTY